MYGICRIWSHFVRRCPTLSHFVLPSTIFVRLCRTLSDYFAFRPALSHFDPLCPTVTHFCNFDPLCPALPRFVAICNPPSIVFVPLDPTFAHFVSPSPHSAPFCPNWSHFAVLHLKYSSDFVRFFDYVAFCPTLSHFASLCSLPYVVFVRFCSTLFFFGAALQSSVDNICSTLSDCMRLCPTLSHPVPLCP